MAYSRFGISTTNKANYITGSSDLLISSDLEVLGTGSFNIASSSVFWLPGTSGARLGDCDAAGDTLNWDLATGKFVCGTDASGGGGGGITGIEVKETSVFQDTNVVSLSFDPSHFAVTASGTEDVLIKLDWGAGGPASLSQNETVTGDWIFNNDVLFQDAGTSRFIFASTSLGRFGFGDVTPEAFFEIASSSGITASISNVFTVNGGAGASVSKPFTFDVNSTRAFVVGDGTGGYSDDIFTVDTTASATNPGIDIVATNLTSAGTSALTISVPASTSSAGLLPGGVWKVTDSLSNTLASMSNAGSLALRGYITARSAYTDCSTSPHAGKCLDYAESYPTNDTTLEAGDIVAADLSKPAYVIKADKGSPILGIVSTKPGILLDDGRVLIGTGAQSKDGFVPVALAGQVPVKASIENGPIVIGDFLTISSVSGVAMKATEPGRVVGMALEPLVKVASNSPDYGIDPNTGQEYQKILIFVNPHWYGGDTADTTLNLSAVSSGSVTYDETGTVDAGGAIFDINILFQSIVNKFNEAFNIVFKQGFLKIAEIFTNKITTKELCLEDVCVTKEQLKVLLNQNNLGVSPPTLPILSPTPSEEQNRGPSISNQSSSSFEEIGATPAPSPEPTPSSTPEPTPLNVSPGETSGEQSAETIVIAEPIPELTPVLTP